jgi:hypothetical protein
MLLFPSNATPIISRHTTSHQALDPEGNLYLGCGDGMIKKMAGRDDRWELLAEVKVSGRSETKVAVFEKGHANEHWV